MRKIFLPLKAHNQSGDILISTLIATGLFVLVIAGFAAVVGNVQKQRLLARQQYQKFLAGSFLVSQVDCEESLRGVNRPCANPTPVTLRTADGRVLANRSGDTLLGNLYVRAQCLGDDIMLQYRNQPHANWLPITDLNLPCPDPCVADISRWTPEPQGMCLGAGNFNNCQSTQSFYILQTIACWIQRDVPSYNGINKVNGGKNASLAFDNATSQKVCELLGYNSFDQMQEHVFSSCNNDAVILWDGSRWTTMDGCTAVRMNKRLRCKF